MHDPFVWWKQWLHCPSPSKPRLCSVINVCEAFRHLKYIYTFEYTGFYYKVNIEHRFIEDEPYTNSDYLYYLLNTGDLTSTKPSPQAHLTQTEQTKSLMCLKGICSGDHL